MAIFRIEKTQDYTVMSNHHLRNKTLSLKAKGLLSQILSLPESWDYTLKGLAQINRESLDAIRSAVQELETAGYISRSRERKKNGQLGGAEYIIREQPPNGFTPNTDPGTPKSGLPAPGKPMSENPTQVTSVLANKTQLNKELLNKDLLNKDLLNKELLTSEEKNTDSIPVRSSSPSLFADIAALPPKRNGREGKPIGEFEKYKDVILENIEYSYLVGRFKYKQEHIDEIVDLILETVCTAKKTSSVAGAEYPAELVKSKLLRLNSSHLEFVLDCLNKNTTKIRNIKKYLLAVLFNASSTIQNYYDALFNHDIASGKLYGGSAAT